MHTRASARTHTHTHTHTHLMRNLSSSEPKDNFIFRLDGPPIDELLKTDTPYNRWKIYHARSSHSQSAALFGQWKYFCKPEMFSLDMFTAARQIDGNWMDMVQYCPQPIQWLSLNTVHTQWILLNSVHRRRILCKTANRQFNGCCVILSTDIRWVLCNTVHRHSVDIVQYCPQIFSGYFAALSTDIRWILCHVVQRHSVDTVPYCPQIFSGYCGILFTYIQWILCRTVHRYSVDTVPYNQWIHLPYIQWILCHTIHRYSVDTVPYCPQIFGGYCAILSTDI